MLRCKLIKVALLGIICFALFPSLAQSQTSRRIHGEVWDGANNHIAGVLVRIYRHYQKIGEYRTSRDGQYAISFTDGGPITTIRYDHTDWIVAVVTSVSGTKDSMINKVLLKPGEQLSYNEQREFASTLELLHAIDLTNGVSENQFRATYAESARMAKLPTEMLAWWTNTPGVKLANLNPDPVTGEWAAEADALGSPIQFTLRLKLDGERVTGTSESAQGEAAVKGTFVSDKLTFSLETANGTIAMTGRIKDGKIVGEFDFAGQTTGRWQARKKDHK